MEQMWHFAMQRQEWRIGWIDPSQERIAISYPSYPEVLIIFKLSVSHIPFPYIFIIFALSKPCWTDERSKSRDPSSLGLCLQVGGRAEGWKPTSGQRRARHIYIKGVTVRFGFDAVRIWQFEHKLSKTKQRERLMGCIIYSPYWLFILRSI